MMSIGDKFLVIGSTSFSAAHFIDFLLGNGHEVTGVSRSAEPHAIFLPYQARNSAGFSFHQFDLNHHLDKIEQLIDSFRPDYVVNFAAQGMVAQSWQHPEHWYTTNVVAHARLHQVVRTREFVKKYVQISTPEVYGNCSGSVKEDTPYNPSTPYAISKAACDMNLQALHRTFGFPAAFTRASNYFGPGQQLYRIVPRTIIYMQLGKKLPLHGGGHSVRSFIHAADMADAAYRVAVDGAPGEAYNVSTNRYITIRDLIKLICEMKDVAFDDFIEVVEDRPSKDQAYILDSGKIRNELGWTDKITLENGIEQTIAWVENNFDIIRKMPLDYIHKP